MEKLSVMEFSLANKRIEKIWKLVMVLWVCVAICKPVLPCYINKIRCLSVSIRSFLEQQEAENLTKLKYKVFYDICRWIKYFIWKKVTFILVYYYSTKFMAVMWVINWAEKIVCIYTILHGLRYIRVSACMLSCFNHVQFFVILWTVAHQGPLSIGFSRQQYWSVLPCPPPRDLSDPRLEPVSPAAPALQVDFLTTETLRMPHIHVYLKICSYYILILYIDNYAKLSYLPTF